MGDAPAHCVLSVTTQSLSPAHICLVMMALFLIPSMPRVIVILPLCIASSLAYLALPFPFEQEIANLPGTPQFLLLILSSLCIPCAPLLSSSHLVRNGVGCLCCELGDHKNTESIVSGPRVPTGGHFISAHNLSHTQRSLPGSIPITLLLLLMHTHAGKLHVKSPAL
ncbi:hypothetical protein OG21DRAFT_1500464 [Imleria badia]|nr:hypothetical protein OG21DRAFT_1500464 [Imleria badia]